MRGTLYHIFLLTALAGCIGVDNIDDPVVGARIVVTEQQTALLPGQTAVFMAEYFDDYGISQVVPLVWSSSVTAVASVSETGLVMANANGQTVIRASYMGVESEPVQLTVVSGPDDVATVEISSPVTTPRIGEMWVLTAVVKNFDGAVLDEDVVWVSDNPDVVAVDAETGAAMALANGQARIRASSSGVLSAAVEITVGNVRSGTFVRSSGYMAQGTATLTVENDELILSLSNDFQTSFALGTYIYLANQTGGSSVLAGGLEVRQITTNGAHRFVVSDVKPDAGLFDYRYVIILCKPAALTFGYADLNP